MGVSHFRAQIGLGQVRWPLTTLAVGALGGSLADAAGLPLGWLLGAMIAAAALCCLRTEARLPQPWRYVGQMVVGLSAGLAFTPALVGHVLGFAPYVVLAVLASIASGIVLSLGLMRAAQVSGTTAYFASMPGGVAEMSNLAERQGGDVAAVAVSQTLRIFLAVLTVPLLTSLIGQEEHVAAIPQGAVLPPLLLLGAAVAAWTLGALFARQRIANGWLLSAMAIGAGVALATAERFQLPHAFLSVAQVLIGTSLGTRLRWEALRRQRRLIPFTLLSTILLLALNMAFAWLLTRLTGAGLTTMLLSTSPGGLAEMSITAVTLKADVSLVTAFHLLRALIVALVSVPLFNLLIKKRAAAPLASERLS